MSDEIKNPCLDIELQETRPNLLKPIPTTIDDALTRLLKMCPAQTKEEILYNGVKPVEFHSGFGRTLRNEWGLWTDSELKRAFLEKGIWHADDMSGILLESTFRILRGEPVDLQGQINYYLEYWKKEGVNPPQ
jgi:hypothetical protein